MPSLRPARRARAVAVPATWRPRVLPTYGSLGTVAVDPASRWTLRPACVTYTAPRNAFAPCCGTGRPRASAWPCRAALPACEAASWSGLNASWCVLVPVDSARTTKTRSAAGAVAPLSAAAGVGHRRGELPCPFARTASAAPTTSSGPTAPPARAEATPQGHRRRSIASRRAPPLRAAEGARRRVCRSAGAT
jgi:hypothetical protein